MSSDRRARLALDIVSAHKKKRNVDASLSVQERINAEKGLLMQDRQAHLESVVDKHDDLVRVCGSLRYTNALISSRFAKPFTSSNLFLSCPMIQTFVFSLNVYLVLCVDIAI
jgi:hypothetical protein